MAAPYPPATTPNPEGTLLAKVCTAVQRPSFCFTNGVLVWITIHNHRPPDRSAEKEKLGRCCKLFWAPPTTEVPGYRLGSRDPVPMSLQRNQTFTQRVYYHTTPIACLQWDACDDYRTRPSSRPPGQLRKRTRSKLQILMGTSEPRGTRIPGRIPDRDPGRDPGRDPRTDPWTDPWTDPRTDPGRIPDGSRTDPENHVGKLSADRNMQRNVVVVPVLVDLNRDNEQQTSNKKRIPPHPTPPSPVVR
jgi:hypothetical protein